MPASTENHDRVAATPGEGTKGKRGAPRPVGLAAPAVATTGDVAAAREALEKAQEAYETAQDTLSDLEGRLAVIEGQDQAADHREAAEATLADLRGRVAVLADKAEAVDADESKAPWQRAAAREDLEKAKRALTVTEKKLARTEAQLEVEAREEIAKVRRTFMRAGRKLQRAEATLTVALDRVEAEERALQVPAPTEDDPEEVRPRFATVELFVQEFVLPNWCHKYERQRVRWCDHWWEHAEAITRLEAIWEAFEVMRLEPAPSFSTWLRDHFDVHMRTLTDPEGVFFNCDSKQGFHEPKDPWPHAAAPEGMFAAIESAQIQAPRQSREATGQAAHDAASTEVSERGGINNSIAKHTPSGATR